MSTTTTLAPAFVSQVSSPLFTQTVTEQLTLFVEEYSESWDDPASHKLFQ